MLAFTASLPYIDPAFAIKAESMIEITDQAAKHRAWRRAGPVYLSPEVHEHVVRWTEVDSRRTDVVDDLDEEIRLDNLLAQAAAAVRQVLDGADTVMFLSEYFDREKRGNPRRARLILRRTHCGLIVDYP